jgi:hypothetical protein
MASKQTEAAVNHLLDAFRALDRELATASTVEAAEAIHVMEIQMRQLTEKLRKQREGGQG